MFGFFGPLSDMTPLHKSLFAYGFNYLSRLVYPLPSCEYSGRPFSFFFSISFDVLTYIPHVLVIGEHLLMCHNACV